MNTWDAILSRSSYRGSYKEETVPRGDLIRIMQAGLAAPSGCNKQTTSLIAVDDPRVLAQIKAVIDPPVGQNCPAMICVLTREIIAYRDRCFNIHDYSAAIENMLLEAVNLGYATCWYEGHITDVDRIGDKIASILGVPEEYHLICILPLGKPAEEPQYVKKQMFSERAWFNGFEQKIDSEKSCGAVIYTHVNGELRFVVVDMSNTNRGLPKGHMEKGESEQQTALREIKEETGLTVTLNERFRTYEEHPLDALSKLKQVIYFLGTYEDQTLSPEDLNEIRGISLLTYEEALRTITFTTDKKVLMEAHQYMERHGLK